MRRSPAAFLDFASRVAKVRRFAAETARWEPYAGFLFRCSPDPINDLRRRLDDETEERRTAQAKLTALLTDQRATAPQKATEGRLARAWSILRGKA